MKKIFVITCNPKEHSSKDAYVQAYIEEVQKHGHEVRVINVYDLNVDYIRAKGDEIDYSLTPELKQAQDSLVWADQIVFVYPIWWLSLPAMLTSFISRVFAEGVVSDMSGMGPKPLMKGKTAVIMQSYSMPFFAMKYFYGDVPLKWWKVVLTDWCGPKIVKRFDFDQIDNVPEKRKQKWLKEVRKFASKV